MRTCEETCDTCQGIASDRCPVVEKDMTPLAQALAQLVQDMGGEHTMLYVNDVFRGSKTKVIVGRGHTRCKGHGAGKSLSKAEISRLMVHLQQTRVLAEVHKHGPHGEVMSAVRTGPQAQPLLSGRLPVRLKMRGAKGKAAKSAPKKRAGGRMAPTNSSANLAKASGAVSSKARALGARSSSEANGGRGAVDTRAPMQMADVFSRKEKPAARQAPKGKGKAAAGSGGGGGGAAGLHGVILNVRKQVAEQQSKIQGITVLPFHILNNTTISAIVKDPPRSLEALAKLPGMGQAKADKYGETFVRARPASTKPCSVSVCARSSHRS